jgi:hypothetical protein
MRLVVVPLNSSLAITRSFLCHLFVDHRFRQLLNLHKLLRFEKTETRVDRCSAARTNVVFTNSYVDNNSSLISE